MTDTALPTFLNGLGDAGKHIAAVDWTATALGPIDGWPLTLRTSVAFMLRSPVAITILWGSEGIMLYNQAYAAFAGERHPAILGTDARAAFPEAAAFNDNVIKTVLAGGTLQYTDQQISWMVDGTLTPFWLNLDYSPLVDERDRVVGVMAMVVDTSAKVRAEERLRGEQGRLQQMFEQAPGFMAMLSGPDHVFTLVNPAYTTLVGGRDVLGQPVASALPEASTQGFVALLDQLYASGKAYAGNAIPFAVDTGPGSAPSQRYLDFVYQPVTGSDGQVVGIFVQGTDVTDRVLAERTMHENESKFRIFAQAMPNQVWSAPASGSLDWFNDRVYEYSGAAPGTLDGDKWGEIVHPDDVAQAAASWVDALAAGSTYETEFRIRRADGVYRWHLVRALPIRDANQDAITRWIGTNTDIDDQRSAATALRDLNATLEQKVGERTAERDRMWRLSSDIMLVADFKGGIHSVNPAFARQLGCTEAEAVGSSFLDLVHPDDLAATLAEVDRLAGGATTLRFENRYRRRDGSYVMLSWSAAPDAGFIHAVGRDIGPERAAAAALRETELALQQAQKMETIGKLTGGVAHDFNNLLQVISGNLQLLASEVRHLPNAARKVDNALAGVARGAKLSNYLLAFGRRQPLAPNVVRLDSSLVAMEDLLRRSLGEAIDIETVVAPDLWNTLVDVTQIENAVLNLAINARDAMDGLGKLTIALANDTLDDLYCRTHPDVTPGQYVRLSVSDTGCGMSDEVLQHAFEPFFSTKAEGKGTGLGLSMVYGLVKQSGGHVKIYSEPGHGTTVKLYLPRSQAETDQLIQEVAGPVVGGSETVLVVEDDEQVRATVVELLGELGYRVLKAADAASALSIVESGMPIDLLFTDVVMPGTLRSPELARRARVVQPDLAVLFTSGYTEDAIVHGGRLDAGVDLLGKPYTRVALARKLRHVLANQLQRNQARAAQPPATRSSAALAPPQAARALRILVVEDDQEIRETTADICQAVGHQVSAAADARAALALLAAQPFDVMLADIGLPDMSGEQLAQQVQRAFPAIRIVMATGQPLAAPLAGALVLRKPYDLKSLKAALEACSGP